MAEIEANAHQNTPSGDDLEARIKADEAARETPEPEAVEAEAEAAPAEPEADAPEAEKEAEPEAEKDPEEDKRISRLAFKEREQRLLNRQLQEEIARLKGQAPPLPKDEDVARQIKEQAAIQAKQMVFFDKTQKIYNDGLKEFKDFDAAVKSINEASELAVGERLPNRVIEAAMEAGEPHKVLYYLSKNLDEAERIIALSPAAMGVALARVAAKIAPAPAAQPKPQSKAPAPIKPIGGKAKAEVSDEEMPIGEYMRRHDERMRSGRGRY